MVADVQLALYAQKFPNLLHDLSGKVSTSVGVDSQWQPKSAENVVHQEVCCSLGRVVRCWKTLYPLGELAHDREEIPVSSRRSGQGPHPVYLEV